MSRTFAVLVALVSSILGGPASAQVTVPNTFAAGSPARASEVNANFQALATAINNLGARVSKLEGNIVAADLAGAYTLTRLQTELGGGNSAYVAVYTATDNLVLAADGTGTLTSGTPEQGHQLNVVTRVLTPFIGSGGGGVLNFTWTYANGKLAAVLGNTTSTFSTVAGGRLLVGASANPADGTNVILLLTRTN